MRRDTFRNKKEAIATCNYEVVPLPKSITPAKEAPFILSTSTHIGYPEGNEKLRQTAVFLSGYIREMTGIETEVTADTGSSNSIRLVLDRTAVSSPEGYRLKVGKRDITITGSSEAGIFYGIQTLRKSLPVTGTKGDKFSGRTDSRRAGIPLPGNASRRRPPFLLD